MDEVKILLQNARILDPESPFNGSEADIFLHDGVIQKVDKNIEIPAETVRNLNGAWVTPGWVDMHAHYNEPGFEFKEDLISGQQNAISGGFTDVVTVPNNDPVSDTKSDIEFTCSQSNGLVLLHPMAALSMGCRGERLTEIMDLHDAGAIAFSDGLLPIKNHELLLKALQYVRQFDGLIISRPTDVHLSENAQMHEGVVSTRLGMKGEPSLSEKIQIASQLDLVQYVDGKIHFTLISSKEGLDEIRKAKNQGIAVTCDVGVHHLLFDDTTVEDFDTVHKVTPPYRTIEDREALLEGIKDGTIDAIVSAHYPQDTESKWVSFDEAQSGATGQQTTLNALLQLEEEIGLDKLIQKLTSGPRAILGLPELSIKEGSYAKLSIFNPQKEWLMDAYTNKSKSANSPFWGQTLKGQCIGLVNGKNYVLDL